MIQHIHLRDVAHIVSVMSLLWLEQASPDVVLVTIGPRKTLGLTLVLRNQILVPTHQYYVELS